MIKYHKTLSFEPEIQKKAGSSLFQGCVDLPEYHQITVNSEDDWEKGELLILCSASVCIK